MKSGPFVKSFIYGVKDTRSKLFMSFVYASTVVKGLLNALCDVQSMWVILECVICNWIWLQVNSWQKVRITILKKKNHCRDICILSNNKLTTFDLCPGWNAVFPLQRRFLSFFVYNNFSNYITSKTGNYKYLCALFTQHVCGVDMIGNDL